MANLLVIDDDRSVRHVIHAAFEDDPSINVLAHEGPADGVQAAENDGADAVLLDIFLPADGSMDAFHKLRALDPKLPIIFIAADTDSDQAIEAMMIGAYDFIIKPLDVRKLQEIVGQAFRTRRMMRTPVQIPLDPHVDSPDHLVGRSRNMVEVYKSIGRVAPQDVTVLIRGESGTGKELVARAVYQHSQRCDGPFLAVNSAALPDTLLESELFGHEKGSFTGADRRRIGKFEQCSGGTIFLDEIGDMSPLLQGKILRLLQEQEFERVGGNETIRTDVRILAATHQDLEQLVADGDFREDLFYRLNSFSITLPPLRARGNDIVLLLEYFLGRLGHELDRRHVEGISPDAVAVLMNYDWPGNVRELENVVRQALLNTAGPVIVPEDLPDDVHGPASRPVPNDPDTSAGDDDGFPPSDLAPLVEAALLEGTDDLFARVTEQMERYLITRVLSHTGGNQSQAAEILGITRGKVAHRIRTFGISVDKDVTLTES